MMPRYAQGDFGPTKASVSMNKPAMILAVLSHEPMFFFTMMILLLFRFWQAGTGAAPLGLRHRIPERRCRVCDLVTKEERKVIAREMMDERGRIKWFSGQFFPFSLSFVSDVDPMFPA
jgi:hypothetical protein